MMIRELCLRGFGPGGGPVIDILIVVRRSHVLWEGQPLTPPHNGSMPISILSVLLLPAGKVRRLSATLPDSTQAI